MGIDIGRFVDLVMGAECPVQPVVGQIKQDRGFKNAEKLRILWKQQFRINSEHEIPHGFSRNPGEATGFP